MSSFIRKTTFLFLFFIKIKHFFQILIQNSKRKKVFLWVNFFFYTFDFSQLRICRQSPLPSPPLHPSPPPPQNCSNFHERYANCWIKWKINFSDFFLVIVECINNIRVTHLDFQVCHRPKKKSFKSGHIYRKDAQWSETNEKSIFLFFKLCSICTQNSLKNWSILSTYYNLVVRSVP